MRLHALVPFLCGLIVATVSPAGAESPAGGYPAPGETRLVSVRSDGSNPGGSIFGGTVDLSADGRYAAFDTDLPLDPGDDNGVEDVYRHDLVTGETLWASEGNAEGGHPLLVVGATHPSMSDDGRFIAFQSTGALVEEDTNEFRDVYLRDLESGELYLLTAGTQTIVWAGHSDSPHLSGDGRFVAFRSSAALLGDDTNEGCDDYLIDREADTLERVSLAADGGQIQGQASCPLNPHGPQVSDDGRFVAFISNSPDVTADPKVFPTQIYVRDRERGTTELVTKNDHGEAANYVSHRPTITPDGRFVAFHSAATNLVPGDRDASMDVYVHDRSSGRTEQVSVDAAGRTTRGSGSLGVDISDDGRFVLFTSWSELDGDDGDFATDAWRHDRLTGSTERVSVDPSGAPEGDAEGFPGLTADGSAAGFWSHGSELDPEADEPPPPGSSWDADAFVRDLGPAFGVGGIEATEDGSAIEIRGWARFDGTVVTGTDEAGDVGEADAALGLDVTGARLVHRPERDDLFVRIDLAELPGGRSPVGGCCEAGLLFQQEPPAGAPGASYQIRFQADGVPHVLRIEPHRGAETGTTFPFVTPGPRIVLERCASACEVLADLEGAVGAVAPAVTARIPLELLSGDAITGLQAVAVFDPGALARDVDAAALPDLPIAAPTARAWIGEALVGATLERGRITASIPTEGLETGVHDVWLEACLGERCGSATTPVTIGP